MYSAIILCAGSGTRMKMSTNKIMLKIGKRHIFEYSVKAFMKYVDEVICVVKENEYAFFKSTLPPKCRVVIGGATRGESVLNGLRECKGDYVLIHDGARPFISPDLIDSIITATPADEAVLTYLPVKDTIKEVNGSTITTLNRGSLIAAVTPQCGPRDKLLDAYERGLSDGLSFTDDMSLLEHYHSEVKINLVLANEEVFKITTALDYELAKLIGENYD